MAQKKRTPHPNDVVVITAKGRQMLSSKTSKLPMQTNVDSEGQGIPNILLATRTEPLNHVLTLKVWGSIAAYIEAHGGADLVRQFIIDGLRRIEDKSLNRPIKCSKCANLVDEKGELYCSCKKVVGLLDRRLLNQVWVCEYFKKREAKK